MPWRYMADVSPYGSQTVTGPGWPNVDEEMPGRCGGDVRGVGGQDERDRVVPQQQGQLMKLSDVWEGAGSAGRDG